MVGVDLAAGGRSSWKRPDLEKVDCNTQSLVFQQVDCDYYDEESPGTRQKQPVIRIYGVSENGHSVCCHVYGFSHYYYVRVPNEWSQPVDRTKIQDFKRILNQVMSRTIGEG